MCAQIFVCTFPYVLYIQIEKYKKIVCPVIAGLNFKINLVIMIRPNKPIKPEPESKA